MAYIETITRGKKQFHYLTQTIRLGDKFKKVRQLLGSGKIPKKKLEELAKKAKNTLDGKIKLVKSTPKIFTLNKKQIRELKEIKKVYKRIISKLSPIEYKVIEKQHLVRFTFNTNAIEGSTITLKETAHILEDKITPAGRELREVHEVENTKKTYYFMKKHRGKVSVPFIKKIHYHLTHNTLDEQSGIFRSIQVYMGGSKHYPSKPKEISKEMRTLLRWMTTHKDIHPVLLAAYVHHFFIAIHPFVDGNGRTGRLLLNFMLMKTGFPPICIRGREKIQYTDYLEAARDGDVSKFVHFIIKKIEESHKEFVDNTNSK